MYGCAPRYSMNDWAAKRSILEEVAVNDLLVKYARVQNKSLVYELPKTSCFTVRMKFYLHKIIVFEDYIVY
jgi:hypothetical protein